MTSTWEYLKEKPSIKQKCMKNNKWILQKNEKDSQNQALKHKIPWYSILQATRDILNMVKGVPQINGQEVKKVDDDAQEK